MSGGTVWGSVYGTTGSVLNFSGSAKIYRSETSLIGNNIWVNSMRVNIGDLNEDAKIGFLNTSAYSSEKTIAYYVGTQPLNLEQIGVYMLGDKDNGKTFALKVTTDNKIVVYQTNP